MYPRSSSPAKPTTMFRPSDRNANRMARLVMRTHAVPSSASANGRPMSATATSATPSHFACGLEKIFTQRLASCPSSPVPNALAAAGTAWVRITNLAILFVFLSLGLNIVVGFAGLLDLGYIAFYAVGAYVYALLASPHFNLHLPFWVILPIGALVACLFGVLLGAPTLKLRGDYLAIVTLGFGEIVRIFLNNLSQPVNITNGPQGISRIDPFRFGSFSFSQTETISGLVFSGPIKYYYLLLILLLLAIVVNLRLQHSRIGRAWEAVREDEIAARAMGINLSLISYTHL